MTEATTRGRGVRAGISQANVVETARRIVDRDGLGALTFRRLAADLGVAPNTLYSHVADKSALLDLLMDGLAGEVTAPDPQAVDWRVGLRALFTSTRATVAASPQLAPLFLSRAPRGPNAIRLGEVTLELLAQGGIEGPPAVLALRALLIYTFGYAAFAAAPSDGPNPRAGTRRAERAFAADPSSPRMTALAGELAAASASAGFEEGLNALIAGIAAQVGRR
jgi:TetR/AcrR family tetracycline transcriptional repressor